MQINNNGKMIDGILESERSSKMEFLDLWYFHRCNYRLLGNDIVCDYMFTFPDVSSYMAPYELKGIKVREDLEMYMKAWIGVIVTIYPEMAEVFPLFGDEHFKNNKV